MLQVIVRNGFLMMLDGGHNDLHHVTCEFFQTPESAQNLEKYLPLTGSKRFAEHQCWNCHILTIDLLLQTHVIR